MPKQTLQAVLEDNVFWEAIGNTAFHATLTKKEIKAKKKALVNAQDVPMNMKADVATLVDNLEMVRKNLGKKDPKGLEEAVSHINASRENILEAINTVAIEKGIDPDVENLQIFLDKMKQEQRSDKETFHLFETLYQDVKNRLGQDDQASHQALGKVKEAFDVYKGMIQENYSKEGGRLTVKPGSFVESVEKLTDKISAFVEMDGDEDVEEALNIIKTDIDNLCGQNYSCPDEVKDDLDYLQQRFDEYTGSDVSVRGEVWDDIADVADRLRGHLLPVTALDQVQKKVENHNPEPTFGFGDENDNRPGSSNC